ncbi:hypothetical protein SELMODRAFT_413955 [Selaginella moellendorffii]|uniref:Cyanovirin-N domain-containing protein n=1 Tax=Selaginella moellendorffii TaxID=88036 RepID=D8RR60_SELML|nr:cyanovirin-N homolog [Selaginella moellendorffii]EFJ25188.1 hypothetical protein SELMODRAFT_413955 [Selaginella moellendorffii]|eukprot:XP_002973528.1 cyanovirin-N homolog [Selaginella moellendorffii]
MASIREIIVVLCMLIVTIQACQFSSSCTGISFDGHTMHAKCRTPYGKHVKSSIDVSQCVGVDYTGKLDCSSNFAAKCGDVEFNGITIGARCATAKGYKRFSNRVLDDCIGNVDGKLTCC